MKGLRTYSINKVPDIFYMGRNTDGFKKNKSLTLFWSGSGIELKVKSSELWAELEAGYTLKEPWICICINGRAVSRQMIKKGRNWICLGRDFDAETVNTYTLYLDTSAYPEDEKHFLKIHRIAVPKNALFFPAEKKSLRIEFVGDSITVGEGLYGAPSETQYVSAFTSVWKTYAMQTARRLNADFRFIAKGGWGIISGWDNNPYTVIPAHYENVCSIVGGKLYKKLGGYCRYNFNEWKPDFVVINLGTNDRGAFYSPPWHDPATGKEYKLSLGDNGLPLKKDGVRISNGIKNFLTVVRKNNPQAVIVWAAGMMYIQEIMEFIKDGIDSYKAESGDGNVFFLELESMAIETCDSERGSRQHPGQKVHDHAAERLTGFIESRINTASK